VRQSAVVRIFISISLALACLAQIIASDRPRAETNSPTVRLTGIVSIGTFRRAYLVREERGHAPEYLSLREGETAGGLEVRRVDAEHGEVRVVGHGYEWLLSFNSQESAERRAERAEKQFVDTHTRAHEELQRREQMRLSQEVAAAAQKEIAH
jgi:hypothetical protein